MSDAIARVGAALVVLAPLSAVWAGAVAYALPLGTTGTAVAAAIWVVFAAGLVLIAFAGAGPDDDIDLVARGERP